MEGLIPKDEPKKTLVLEPTQISDFQLEFDQSQYFPIYPADHHIDFLSKILNVRKHATWPGGWWVFG